MPDWTPRDTDRARELRNNATPAERLLWQYLRRRQTGAKFSRQMQIGRIFPDFLCRELKLIVECDGISHDREPERDARRDGWLGGRGYTILRFPNAEVLSNVEGVVKAIELKVAQLRSLRTGPPLAPPAGGRGKG
jgi:very-short-patch-repair endonuclease